METTLHTPEQIRAALRSAIPFLRKIPDNIYTKLDTSEFVVPEGEVAKARVELENALGQNIMTYNRDVFNLEIPVESHLCANLRPALLSERQFNLLQRYEQQFADQHVSFVAYLKPVALMNPKESPIYQLYRERGLLPRTRRTTRV